MSVSLVCYTQHTSSCLTGKHLCSRVQGVILNPAPVVGCPTCPSQTVQFRELHATHFFSVLRWLRRFQLASPEPSSLRQAPRRALEILYARFPSTSSLLSASSSRSRLSFSFMLRQAVSIALVSLHSRLAHYLHPDGTYKASNTGFGATHGIHILCIISLLLLTREAFFTATSNNFTKQNDEDWWYPFAALTEFVAVVMFAAPGLVPSRDELPS